MNGCYDLKVDGNKLVVSGWAYNEKKKEISQASCIELHGFFPIRQVRLQFNTVKREDFKNVTDKEIGFVFELPEYVTKESILWGHFQIIIYFGVDYFTLPIWHRSKEKLLTEYANKGSKYQASHYEVDATKKENYSNFTIKIGTMSPGNEVVIGKNGMSFLVGGTNAVQAFFENKGDKIIDSWTKLIEARENKISAMGKKYFQVIAPEKQSLYPELMPYPLASPSPSLKGINDFFSKKNATCFVNPIPALLAAKPTTSVVRQMDCQLSFEGMWISFCEILKAMGEKIPDAAKETYTAISPGDLSEKFDILLYDNISLPCVKSWPFAQSKPKLTHSFDPQGNAHIGIERTFVNDKPISDKKVLIFGNSITERGENPLGLLWFFSRYFKEVVFKWMPQVDYGFVKMQNPDYVVCQTVERFLNTTPIDIA